MTSISVRPDFWLLLCALVATGAQAGNTEFGGHTKLGVTGQSYPSDSVLRDTFGNTSADTQADLRLNVMHRQDGWAFAGDYQLVFLNGEALTLTNDDRRRLDLTRVVDQGSKSALLHRLDRLWIGYSSENTVLRLGRQALSWGNGQFYAPMDLVNPFDPAAVDTEYKAGDDMLYLQYLRDNGADVQGAYVFRRDPLSGRAGNEVATAAAKYHGFAAGGEFDLLFARHYGDTVAGLGAGHAVGGAQWSGDLVITDTDVDTYVQLTTNLSYTWMAFGKNVSGTVEYHFNGFGLSAADYGPGSLIAHPDLARRLARGESFALGRHYLAGSLAIEVTPLWTISPTLLVNAGDPSGLLQLITSYSLSDDMTFLASLNVPVGGNGTEFGGIEAAVPGRYFATRMGLFARLAWYF